MDFFHILNHLNKLSLEEREQFKKTNNFNWKHILPNLQLSEKILEMFADQLDWKDVIRYQNISDNFYMRHKFRINKE